MAVQVACAVLHAQYRQSTLLVTHETCCLQASACGLGITYGQDCRLPDVPAEYASSIHLRGLSVDFLNNSSSRWERVVEPWPLAVAISDPINPMFKSSRTRWGTLHDGVCHTSALCMQCVAATCH